MSDSDEPVTPVQESQPSDAESSSQQGDMSENSKKRMLDTDEDEDSESESSRLDHPKKKGKPTARKLDFVPTEDDPLPLDCSICGKPFSNPVVTKCQHYFCELCVLKHHEEKNTCFVCDEPTLGVFNTAVEIKKRISEEREKVRAMVKEVSTMVETASKMADDAGPVAEDAVKMVKEIETMLDTAAEMATKAGGLAMKAVEMVQEAEATMETAKANMAEALAVMKSVMWND